jgi:hypothetical protein
LEYVGTLYRCSHYDPDIASCLYYVK